MNSYNEEPSTHDPVRLSRDENGWTADCKFCSTSAGPYLTPEYVRGEIMSHANSEHYWWPSDLYVNPVVMEQNRERRRAYRAIMGGPEEAAAMNRLDL